MTDWYDASDATPGKLWAEASIVAERCYTAVGEEVGPYVGMASVARDMIRIVDALGEDGMLRFWGKISLPPHLYIYKYYVTNSGRLTVKTHHIRHFWRDSLGRHRCRHVPGAD